MQYGFQAWNTHIPGRYRDLLFGIGAEEFGHVEMLATMIAQLLEKAPVGVSDDAVQSDPTIAAIVGGTDVQHAIVAGAGARPVDSNGNPWSGAYITSSGNLLADFTANANAYQYINFSDGAEAAEGRWAKGVPMPPPTVPNSGSTAPQPYPTRWSRRPH